MSQPRKKHFLVSLFGVLFYVTVTLGWLWSVLPYIPDLARISTSLQQPVIPAEPAQQIVTTGPPSLLLIVIAVVVTIILLGLTIYTLVKLPATVSKTGEKFTKNTSDYIVPLVTHHAPLSEKKRRQLTARVMFYVKLMGCIIPVIIAALSFFVTAVLPYSIIVLVSTFLAITALVLLCLQALFAKWLRVSLDGVRP